MEDDGVAGGVVIPPAGLSKRMSPAMMCCDSDATSNVENATPSYRSRDVNLVDSVPTSRALEADAAMMTVLERW